MNEELLIVFGAGAAHDCADINRTTPSEDHRPPLTSKIFSRYKQLTGGLADSDLINPFKNRILNKHDFASSIGYELNNSESLEEYLQKLKSSHIDSERRKYFALCIYLQDLFSEISKMYLNAACDNNFHSLVCKLVKTDYSRFNFITTNYDTIFDVTLERLFRINFDSLGSYLNFTGDGKVFNFIKAHGSVNWSYVLNNDCAPLSNAVHVKNGTINITEKMVSSIENADQVIVGKPGVSYDAVMFPAMAVPLGTYKFVNQNQIDNFKNQNFNIRNLLIIGYSGQDNTIFELLNKIIKIKINIFIVDTTQEKVETIAKVFRQKLDERIQFETYYYPGGFTGFINKHSEAWIKIIQAKNNFATYPVVA